MSCAFATSLSSHEDAAFAEALGFRRAYFYDSPALYADLWVQLCRAADRTERIGLGAAVVVPSNRHVMTTASAIGTLAAICGPERISVAVGAGRTGRLTFNEKPLRWTEVAAYIRALRGLLRGEVVDWAGKRIGMLHSEAHGPARPLDVEILVGAAGPKGVAVARELGDGVIGGTHCVPGFQRSPAMTWGTVLRPGELRDDPRVIDAAGPSAAVFEGHYPIHLADPAQDSAHVRRWRAAYADVPAEELHLAIHTGHLSYVNERDKAFVDGTVIGAAGTALDAEGWAERLDSFAANGVSEVVYQPAGSHIRDELDAFAGVFQSWSDRRAGA